MSRRNHRPETISDMFAPIRFLTALIASAYFDLAIALLLIGIFLVGLLMIFDSDYLFLFNQWGIACILYVIHLVTRLAFRFGQQHDEVRIYLIAPPPSNTVIDRYAWPQQSELRLLTDRMSTTHASC
ncbi:MAG: hypothetical protein WCF85_09395, partial [Rhodospirillaceae bacterium]